MRSSPIDAPARRGVYVHVPYCARACPYCDFDFDVGRNPDTDGYLDALARELAGRELLEQVETLYVGGGTPSLLGPRGIARLLGCLRHAYPSTRLREVTVELNPEHTTDDLVASLLAAGVDRVSLGVQSFDPEGLRQLGRVHHPDEADAAVQRCVRAGLRTSVDLIVGWPAQIDAALAADIARAVDLGADHASIYALTIEAGTPWPGLVTRGLRRDPDPDRQAALLLAAEAQLEAAGFEHYEISNYARPGSRSIHNQMYWTWGDYDGVGPSAAAARYGSDGSVRRRAGVRGVGRWRRDPLAGSAERLEPAHAAAEGLWLALRRLEGVDLGAFGERFPGLGREFVAARVAEQVARGNLCWRGPEQLMMAPSRWQWHDDVGAGVLAAPH